MTRHFAEELQDALDGRLDAVARAEVEAHLDECAACRSEHERLAWVKAVLAATPDDEPVPEDLAARISAALDDEDRSAAADAPLRAAVGAPRGSRTTRPLLAALAAALVLAVGVALWRSGGEAEPPGLLARDYVRYQQGALPLGLETDDAARLQGFFASAHLGFDVRVLDLAMMGYRLVGGGVQTVAGRPAALMVYRTAAGQVVLCVMFPADAARAGAGAASVRSHGGFDFVVHRVSDLTVVMWQEGTVTCALIAGGDPEAVVQLAFAKAMRAS
jgi:anti-sigma factor RsiW